MQSAEYSDKHELASLIVEQSQILASLSRNDNKTLKEKIIRLAHIIDERMELADPTFDKKFTRSQISTYITHLCGDLPIADVVRRYLPPEYKDQSQVRNIILEDGGTDVREIVANLTALADFKKPITEAIAQLASAADLATLNELGKLLTNKTAEQASKLHITLPGYEHSREHKTPMDEPKVGTCAEEMDGIIEAMKEFKQFIIEVPPPPELEQKWATGLREFKKLWPSFSNHKFSLVKIQWFSRIKYVFHQSKHGAAVKDEIMTILCENCYDEKKGEERPNCNAEMEWDYKSPTHWRCPTCGGVKGHWRGLTREQVGDNKAPILSQAEELVYNLYFFYEILEYYVTASMPRDYARKIDLGVELGSKA